MKRIRYLTLMLLAMLGTATARAQDDGFDPADPAEPGQIVAKSQLTVVASPVSGGSVSGGGKYASDTQVELNATAYSDYTFVSWTNASGTVVSTNSTFSYTKGAHNETLTANFEFTPNGPGEPGDINLNVKHWLYITAEEGGTVSSSARYKAGTNVTVNASPLYLYDFDGWFTGDGILLTTATSYTLTMPAEDLQLQARFTYNPTDPSEPGEIKARHVLKLMTEEGGTVSADSYRLTEGESTTIRATASWGFEFAGWYKNGVLVTESPEFTYEMGSQNVEFTARFSYNPDSPDEPQKIEEKKYAFYMMNIIGKPGNVVEFPVYLTTREEARDLTFQLSFPENLLPDLTAYTVSDAAAGYTVTFNDGESTDGRKSYVFNMTAGDMPLPVGNTSLLTFNVSIPDNIETAKGYQVTINQVSVADADGNSQTAGTRNGRISVYKNGDANGDDKVSIVDVVCVVNSILGNPSDDFIEEAANVNDDEGISIVDAVGVVNIILGDGDNDSRQEDKPVESPEPE